MEIQKVKNLLNVLIEASKEIELIYLTNSTVELKSDGSPVTLADKISNQILLKFLNQLNIPTISEETTQLNYSIRNLWNKCWLLDPLDGTKEFIKKTGEFAICLALIENEKPIFGFIASPIEKKILLGGSYFNPTIINFEDIDYPEKWIQIKNESTLNSPLKIAASISHFSEKDAQFISQVEKLFEVSYSKKGSALKFFDLALGTIDLYPRFSPTMEWDIAAGQAILEALGGGVFDALTLKPLTYNKADLHNPQFIACSKAFLPYLRELSKES